MSVYVTTHVWHHSRLRGDALLLLLAIADEANDTGECWPGRAHLARKTRLSERTVQSLTPTLIDSGELAIAQEAHGPGNPRIFRVNVPEVVHATPRGRGRPRAPKGEAATSPNGRAKGEDSSPNGLGQREKLEGVEREKGVPLKGEDSGRKGRSPAIRYPVDPPVNTRIPADPHSGMRAEAQKSGSENPDLSLGFFDPDVEQGLTYRMGRVAADLEDDSVAACISQARKLLRQSGLEWHEFDNRIKDAYHRTLKRRDDASKPRLGIPMAWFFETLRTLTLGERAGAPA